MARQPSDRSLYLGIALLAGASLLHELVLTRLFSVVHWYHFALAVISLALLGIGAGGVWLYVRLDRYPPERLRSQLAGCALGFGLAAPGGTLLMLGVAPLPMLSAPTIVALSIHLLAAALPFFFVGLAIGLALTHRTEIAGRIYAADLIGAGLGCFSVVKLMSIFDLGGAVLVIGMLGLLAALLLSPRRWRPAVSLLLALGLLLGSHVLRPWFTIQATKSGLETAEGWDREWEDWTALARIAVFPLPGAGARPPSGWGISSRWRGRSVEEKLLIIDAAASTAITRWEGSDDGLAVLDHLDWDATSLGHHLRPEGRCLIVGAGGGRDLLTALRFRQRVIRAVEINPSIARAMRGPFREFSGGIYDHPGVEIIVDEARSWLERDEETCDLIQISMIDTWAASAAGAFVFSEAHLYTVEAFETFFDRLAPGGVLAVSRWCNPEVPGETLRLEGLALEAWRRAGVEDPARHMAIITSNTGANVGTLLMSRDPLTVGDMMLLRALCEQMGFTPLWMPDGRVAPSLFSDLAQADDVTAFAARQRFDVSPTTDDRPFFFHMLRPGDVLAVLLGQEEDMENAFSIEANYRAVKVLMVLVALVSLFALAFILAPLALARREDLAASRGPWRLRLLLYFACLGVGFMLIEIPQIQRLSLFLGHPIYALSVVLATLLVGGGCGSFLVRGVEPPDAAPRLGLTLPLLVAVTLAYTWLQPPLLAAGLGWPTAMRIAVAVALLLPLGLLLGMPLPLGLQVASAHAPRLIPWLWGVNGAMSVVGSVGALCVGLILGFQSGLLLGVAVYLAAWALIVRGRAA
ncbi:hypothetical protein JXA47_08225 [Candidatus Sumerlaeota bacterium]|nr:hypothetical protein [Candidatus Sumerlaeota bacterium]